MSLAELPPGDYVAQAVINIYEQGPPRRRKNNLGSPSTTAR
jgi:hypothetical protein